HHSRPVRVRQHCHDSSRSSGCSLSTMRSRRSASSTDTSLMVTRAPSGPSTDTAGAFPPRVERHWVIDTASDAALKPDPMTRERTSSNPPIPPSGMRPAMSHRKSAWRGAWGSTNSQSCSERSSSSAAATSPVESLNRTGTSLSGDGVLHVARTGTMSGGGRCPCGPSPPGSDPPPRKSGRQRQYTVGTFSLFEEGEQRRDQAQSDHRRRKGRQEQGAPGHQRRPRQGAEARAAGRYLADVPAEGRGG